MKVVKLNKTHNLYHWGYSYAIRFPYRTRQVTNLIDQLHQHFGQDNNKRFVYRARKDRPLWIGFKDEKIISFVLMLG